MPMNWIAVWNRLWSILDSQGECYYSGGRFLDSLREVDPAVPAYGDLMQQLKAQGKSTSRKDYFRDLFMALGDERCARFTRQLLAETKECGGAAALEIRSMLGGDASRPEALVPAAAWNAERLNQMLSDIDDAIALGTYERAVTLSYTCLEGFYGAYIRARYPGSEPPNELIALSKVVRDDLKASVQDVPGEILNLLTQTAHAIDRARNRFSESHFAGEAAVWLATHCRDLVNTEIRLLLHFM